MVGWARCGFHKKLGEIHYAELVFLYPVGYVGHVVHCGASGPRIVDALFLMLGWAGCGFHKKRRGTRDAELVFLHLVGSKGLMKQKNVGSGFDYLISERWTH
jgi:hypothetical protein